MKEKTVLINCSPKKKMSVSGFLMKCVKLLIRGERVCLPLRVPADRERILRELKEADRVIFVMPLYVDGVPSHVLPFLKEAERFCRESSLRLKVYVLANNGFIEGRQNEPLMQVMENFCSRSGLVWSGGVGIGGGVMLNVMRILIPVQTALTVLSGAAGLTRGEGIGELLTSIGLIALETAFLCSGVAAYLLRLARHIGRGTDAGKRYTRIMLPSFLFILIADLFFAVISLFRGGLFRGWLCRFKPDEKGDIIQG